MNKKIILTRAEHDNKKWVTFLRERHLPVATLPLIETKPIAFSITHSYEWIFFTSAKTVHYFAKQYDLQSFPAKIAVIGSKTKTTLQAYGRVADFEPSEFVAEVFLKEWLIENPKSGRILLPKSNLARDIIAKTLRENEYTIDEVTIYHTIMPESSEKKFINLMKESDYLLLFTFASPSAWQHFNKLCIENNVSMDEVTIASIGPVTTKVIEEAGYFVNYQPTDTYTMAALIDKILREEQKE